MNLKTAIKSRKSVRRFIDKKPDWRKIVRAIDAARYAPSAGNQFITRFILVQDKKKIEKIGKATQQEFVGKSNALVVVVNETSKLERLFKEKAKHYAGQQAGAAIQNFLLQLTEEGLVTTWVGHFYEDEVKLTLEIKDEDIEAIFPIGIETKLKTHEKPTRELEEIIYFDKWKNKKMTPETRVSVESV